MVKMAYTTIGLLVFSTATLAQEVPPPGFEIINITRDPEVRHTPTDLSNCGQAVFFARLEPTWGSSEVFLYDNGRITRITDNDDRDVFPVILESGRVAWERGIGADGTSQLLTLIEGEEVLLVEHPLGVWGGTMNNPGQYAWAEYLAEGCAHGDTEMYMFDGEDVIQITFGGVSAQVPDLNDRGELVWVEFDSCQDPVGITAMHYHDGTYTQIGGEMDRSSVPVINNRSQVAYSGRNFGDSAWSIRLWEDGVSREVIPAPATVPAINNLGDIAFGVWPLPEGEYKQVWIYDGDTKEATQMTEDPWHNAARAINDYGEVVIAGLEFGQNYQVRLLRRIRTGDSEFDGDIDIDDLAKLVDCMTGPMWVERVNPGPEESLCECRFLDINHDGSVDLRDTDSPLDSGSQVRYTLGSSDFGQGDD